VCEGVKASVWSPTVTCHPWPGRIRKFAAGAKSRFDCLAGGSRMIENWINKYFLHSISGGGAGREAAFKSYQEALGRRRLDKRGLSF